MWIAAGALLYFRRKQLRKTDLMRRVETSQAEQVSSLSAGTPVEVKGFLRCEEPLKSEMAGHECTCYLSQLSASTVRPIGTRTETCRRGGARR